jgi:hypothetical protein
MGITHPHPGYSHEFIVDIEQRGQPLPRRCSRLLEKVLEALAWSIGLNLNLFRALAQFFLDETL